MCQWKPCQYFHKMLIGFANIILRRTSKKCKHLVDFYEKWCLSSISYHWIKKENKPREYIQISYDKEAHFLSCEIMNKKYHYFLSITQIGSQNLFMMSLSWSPSSLQDSTKEIWRYRKEVKEEKKRVMILNSMRLSRSVNISSEFITFSSPLLSCLLHD